MENNLKVYFENGEIVVIEKPEGVTSEDGIKQLLAPREVFTVHRLDKEVGGVCVYAKTPKAAAFLSGEIQNGKFHKEYLALPEGETEEKGELSDLLFHDKVKNKTYVVKNERKGVKKALLTYQKEGTRLIEGKVFSLLKIKLMTGRTHQIRVQLASRKHPLYGDRKYGSAFSGRIGLHCYKISFTEPVSKKTVEFVSEPIGFPWADNMN